jgi:SMI1/KNR4 family protein SUKH-1
VISHWEHEAIQMLPGASAPELEAFEEARSVRLPGDVRSFLQTVNGMPDTEMGGDLFRFWSLGEYKCPAEWGAGEPWAMERRDLILFADFSIDAFAWGMSLAPEGYGEVLPVGLLGRPVVVAHSFSEFLERYLAQSGVLFGADAFAGP